MPCHCCHGGANISRSSSFDAKGGALMIALTGDGLSLREALSKEWLETNSRGGYSSSTVANCHTRRYHGLLVTNLPDRGGRFVLLSKFEDSIRFGESSIRFSLHQYPEVFDPPGLPALVRFSLGLHPSFTYRADGIQIEKSIMLSGESDVFLARYEYRKGEGPVRLSVRPFFAYRGIHELSQENNVFRNIADPLKGGFSIAPYDAMPRMFALSGHAMEFIPAPHWYCSFEYDVERERGFDYSEDLPTPGFLECQLDPGDRVTLSFSLGEPPDEAEQLWERELNRRRRHRASRRKKIRGENLLQEHLAEAGGAFIIGDSRHDLSVVAGYHWFYVWGRDTLISLPGLTFYRGRMRDGLDILKSLGSLRRNGLIPNCLSDGNDDAAYNSVDASLWYFWCLQEYVRLSGDMDTIRRRFWTVMKDILEHYREAGKDNPVVRLESGLLAVGDGTTQLTWMDAAVDSVPVTPRSGCPVEINALWYNALAFTRDMARKTGVDPGFDVTAELERTKQAFNDLFWIPGGEYLADVWNTNNGSRDESVRPNQIFAVSLPHTPLDGRERARKIVKKVTDELLTPRGLRTLSPLDPRYRGQYGGDAATRDAAYHQGTVWPWLLGHYGEALLKTARDKRAARRKLAALLANFEPHLYEAGLGFVSEIFDGDEPHAPGGCIAQAWSVAELYRLSRLIARRG
ncbi:MAG TPA: glycogen debranching protein [Deltaproteobacteria bacterium]|nr:glycogen debranching protein [Deltaproteobacteria bacterium]